MDSSSEFTDIEAMEREGNRIRRMGCAGMMSSGLLLLSLSLIYVAGAFRPDGRSESELSARNLGPCDKPGDEEAKFDASPPQVEMATRQSLGTPEFIDCELSEKDQQSMVMLMSTELEGLALNTFLNMLRKLPKAQHVKDSQLKVLLLEDAAMLQNAFWNPKDPNFNQDTGLNFQKMKQKAGLRISGEKVEEWTKGFQGLDGGWIYDNSLDEVMSGIFDREAFEHVSIFDRCASEAQAQALFELQAQYRLPKVAMRVDESHPCVAELEQLLDEASVIVSNGGNPDLLGFVLRKFAPDIGKMISERVRSGRLLYMGRSAGAMAASADFAYTYEPMPMLAEVLLQGDTAGLALAGRCAIRPHYRNLLWDIPARVLQKLRGEVTLLTENGEGLACDQGHCFMVGATSQQGFDIFRLHSEHLLRIFKAYQFAYKDYKPPRPNLVQCRPSERIQCEDRRHLPNTSLVMLGSSDLAAADAQDAFRSLLSELPMSKRSKVLVLDDAALLTRSFWDSSAPRFSSPTALTYVKAGLTTSLELVRAATQNFANMDEGWIECLHCGSSTLPGFQMDDFTRASALDLCATEEQKKALFRLQSQGAAPEVSMTNLADAQCLERLEGMLEAARVVLVSSGNPDLLGYVYRVLVPRFTAKIVQRVREGSLIFVGLGAGAMVAGYDFALTAAPKPIISELLLPDLQGLRLAGRCAVRPGWNNTNRLWDLTSSLYGNAAGVEIIGLQDGDVLTCLHGRCTVRGRTKQRGKTTLDCDGASLHRGRLDNAMAASFQAASFKK